MSLAALRALLICAQLSISRKKTLKKPCRVGTKVLRFIHTEISNKKKIDFFFAAAWWSNQQPVGRRSCGIETGVYPPGVGVYQLLTLTSPSLSGTEKGSIKWTTLEQKVRRL
uniref:Secreted protein n=1 Tax=Cacopsylla melanoneura TaxID=428564 RepID=A0A8D8Y1Y0_9HEMI